MDSASGEERNVTALLLPFKVFAEVESGNQRKRINAEVSKQADDHRLMQHSEHSMGYMSVASLGHFKAFFLFSGAGSAMERGRNSTLCAFCHFKSADSPLSCCVYPALPS